MKNFLEKIMNFDSDYELENFACRFLEIHGAEVEKNEKGFEVLLPENLSNLLETPEYFHINKIIASKPDQESGAVYSINYGSHLLEKIVNAACSKVPVLRCQLQFAYLKSAGFDRLIKERIDFYGSRGSVESWAKINTEYLFLTCRYNARSDEQKEGLVTLIFNLETGAHVPDMAQGLVSAAKDFKTNKKMSIQEDKKIKEIFDCIKRETEGAISNELGPFQESMNRRFRRDVANLEEYFAGLKMEMEKSLERPGLSSQLIEERREKIAFLPDELSRKKDDLFKKYSIKVKIEPCSAMFINTPAIKILFRASIGKKNKNLSLTYNPVTKTIDPLVCEGCRKSTTHVYFCNHLHLLCQVCGCNCPLC